MNIMVNEVLSLDKRNLNYGMKRIQNMPVTASAEQPNYAMSTINAQNYSNVPFQGASVKNLTKPLLAAGAIALAAAVAPSCTIDTRSEAIVNVDMSGVESRIDQTNNKLDSLNNNITQLRAEINARFGNFDSYLLQLIALGQITNDELKQIRAREEDIKQLGEAGVLKLKDIETLLLAMQKQLEGNHLEVVALLQAQTENQELMLDLLYGIRGDLAKYVKDLLNNQNLSIEAQKEANKYLALLFSTVQNIDQNVFANNKEANELLKAILQVVTEDLENDRIANKERKAFYNAVISGIATMNEQEAKFFKQILAKLDKMDAQQVAFFAAMLDRMDDMSEQGRASTLEIIKAINNNTEVAEGNAEAVNAIKILNGHMYEALLAIANNYNGGISDKLLDYFNQIIKNQNTSIQNQNDIKAAQADFFKVVAEALANMDKHQQDGVLKIVEAITTGDVNIVKAIEGLGKDGQTALTEIIKGINKGNDIAQKTYDVVVGIVGDIQKLGTVGDKILVEVSKIYNKPGVDLTALENYVKQLLAQAKDNGKVQIEIRDKIEYMKVLIDVLQPILLEQANDTEAIRALLKAFYDKYEPCKHECDHSTLENILVELKVIIEEIRENTKNHEGILDDVDLG